MCIFTRKINILSDYNKMNVENQTTQSPHRPLLPVWATIPLYLTAIFVSIVLLGVFLQILFIVLPKSGSVYDVIAEKLILSISSMACAWGCAVHFLKYVDRRPVSELGMSIKRRWKDCLAGIASAAVCYMVGFVVSIGLGAIEITGIAVDFGVLIGTFLVFFTAAAMEEVMVRGYIQGRLMTTTNKFTAMVIASFIFSAMHIFNSNIGILPLFNLFLAGLLLGASYMYTRNLWFPISFHTAWNWLQGPVLGSEVSGTKVFPSVIQLHLPEENIINGGRFGFEGSILCTVLMIVGTVLIIGWFERPQKIRDFFTSLFARDI
jgi:membrane protease YdiL (CAAX protease family)